MSNQAIQTVQKGSPMHKRAIEWARKQVKVNKTGQVTDVTSIFMIGKQVICFNYLTERGAGAIYDGRFSDCLASAMNDAEKQISFY